MDPLEVAELKKIPLFLIPGGVFSCGNIYIKPPATEKPNEIIKKTQGFSKPMPVNEIKSKRMPVANNPSPNFILKLKP
jgi:hypothetical protein